MAPKQKPAAEIGSLEQIGRKWRAHAKGKEGQALPKTIPVAPENLIWNKCYKKYSYGLKSLPFEPLWRQEAAKGLPKWDGFWRSAAEAAACKYPNTSVIPCIPCTLQAELREVGVSETQLVCQNTPSYLF